MGSRRRFDYMLNDKMTGNFGLTYNSVTTDPAADYIGIMAGVSMSF